MLAQLFDRMGDLLEDMGAVKARLDSGQRQMESMRAEHAGLRDMLQPVAEKVKAWDEHIEAAKDTTTKFTAMEPEFEKMRTVTARFMTVALVQGSVVGAALWGLTLIWPVVWGWIKSHVSINMGG
jgi:hypothetical protein